MDQKTRQEREEAWKRGMDDKFKIANRKSIGSDEARETYSSLLRNIPTPIAGVLRGKDLAMEAGRQIGKAGKGIDPRLAALENIGGKAPMSEEDVEQAFNSAKTASMMKLKGFPGMKLDNTDIRAGKAREVINKLKSGTPGEQAEGYAKLSDYMKKGAYEKYGLADADLGYIKGANTPLIKPPFDTLRATKSYIESGGKTPLSAIKMTTPELERDILKKLNPIGRTASSGVEDDEILERKINQFLQSGSLKSFGIDSIASPARSKY